MAVDNSIILLKLEKSEAYFAEEIDKIYQSELLGIDLDCKKEAFLDCIFSLITSLRFRIDRSIYDDTTIDLYNKLERELPFDLYDILLDPNYTSIVVIIVSGDSNFKTFLSLLDTPDTYSGQANKFVSVKSDESGLEFLTTDFTNVIHKTGFSSETKIGDLVLSNSGGDSLLTYNFTGITSNAANPGGSTHYSIKFNSQGIQINATDILFNNTGDGGGIYGRFGNGSNGPFSEFTHLRVTDTPVDNLDVVRLQDLMNVIPTLNNGYTF